MILSNDPGKPFDYPFALIRLEGSRAANRTLHAPVTGWFHTHKVYLILAHGFKWQFIIPTNSDGLTDKYPFVGVLPELVILIEHTTDAQFFREIRPNIPQ